MSIVEGVCYSMIMDLECWISGGGVQLAGVILNEMFTWRAVGGMIMSYAGACDGQTRQRGELGPRMTFLSMWGKGIGGKCVHTAVLNTASV